MTELGKVSVRVWMTAAEHEACGVAAGRVWKPLSTWMRELAVAAANESLAKLPRGSK